VSPLSIEATISETRCIAVSRVGEFFSVFVGMVGWRLSGGTTPHIAIGRNTPVGEICYGLVIKIHKLANLSN
jgi:hypothetical protein